jgi:hypothetical protein
VTGATAAGAQENGSGNDSGTQGGANGTETGGGDATGTPGGGNATGTPGGEGGGEGGGGQSFDTDSLVLILAAAVMAALSPLVFGVLLLLRGRGGGDGDAGGSSEGRRFDTP